MTTSAEKPVKPKRKKKSDLEVLEMFDQDFHDLAIAFVDENDLQFFIDKKTVSQATHLFRDKYSLKKYKVSELNVVIRYAAKDACFFWRVKSKPKMKSTVAPYKYWDRLKVVVARLRSILTRDEVNEEIALRIIQTQISTNINLLRGLPTKYQVWNK